MIRINDNTRHMFVYRPCIDCQFDVNSLTAVCWALCLKCVGCVSECAAMFAVTDRIGPKIPMVVGLNILLGSTIVFGFGKSYGVLISARAVQVCMFVHCVCVCVYVC